MYHQSACFVREHRLLANLLYSATSGSDFKKEHCLYLNSDYKVCPYDKYYLNRLSQIDCVLNISALL